MEQVIAPKQTVKGLAIKVFKNIGQAVIWMIVQLVVILCFECVRLSPAGLIPTIAHTHGPVAVMYGILFNAVCAVIGVIYTTVGIVVCNIFEINSERWWKAILVLYAIYMIITISGMMAAMGAWFFEGYGFLILNVWMAPILWIGEMEIWLHIKKKFRTKE